MFPRISTSKSPGRTRPLEHFAREHGVVFLAVRRVQGPRSAHVDVHGLEVAVILKHGDALAPCGQSYQICAWKPDRKVLGIFGSYTPTQPLVSSAEWPVKAALGCFA